MLFPKVDKLFRAVPRSREGDYLGWHFHFWCFVSAFLSPLVLFGIIKRAEKRMEMLFEENKARKNDFVGNMVDQNPTDVREYLSKQYMDKTTKEQISQMYILRKVTILEEKMAALETQRIVEKAGEVAADAARTFLMTQTVRREMAMKEFLETTGHVRGNPTEQSVVFKMFDHTKQRVSEFVTANESKISLTALKESVSPVVDKIMSVIKKE